MNNFNEDRVDEITLALLYLVTDQGTQRAWKAFDWETMDRLHKKGFISDPRCKNKSVLLSDEAMQLSESLFKTNFAVKNKSL